MGAYTWEKTKHRVGRLAGFAAIAALIVLANLRLMSPWVGTHYLFRTSDGFYARALMGTLLERLWGRAPIPLARLDALALWMLSLLCLALCLLVARFVRKRHDVSALALGLVFLTSPGTIAFFAVDLGRLDQWGMLVFLASLPLFLRLPAWGQKLWMGVVVLLLALLHEVLAVTLGCLYLALYLVRHHARFARPAGFVREGVGLSLALLPAVLLTLWLLGPARLPYSQDALAAAVDMVSEHATFEASKDAVIVQFRSMGENMAFTRRVTRTPLFRLKAGIAALALMPSLLVGVVSVLRLMARRLRAMQGAQPGQRLVLAAAVALLFAPLSLFAVGIDHPRWLATLVFNLFVFRFLFPESKSRVWTTGGRRLAIAGLIGLCVLQVVVGGITATQGPVRLTTFFLARMPGLFEALTGG